MFHCSYNRAGGGRRGGERGTSASTVLDFGILDLAVAGGKVWSKGGAGKGCLCHAGGVEDEEVPGQGLRLNCRNAWCCWG